MADSDLGGYDMPPSYEEACYQQSKVNVNRGFCAVDFVPKKPASRFQNLIENANEWLKTHPEWIVKNCETIKYPCNGGVPEGSKVTFNSNTFLRCLRLWLIPNSGSSAQPVQLGYFNEIPAVLPKKKPNQQPEFEDLQTLVGKLNNKLLSNPLNGQILTVESLSIPCNVTKHQSDWMDADKLLFSDSDFQVVILRIFYMTGIVSWATIEIKDFVPKELPYTHARNELIRHEPFADLLQQAAHFTKDTQICNIQCVPTTVISEYHRSGSVILLRVVILKQHPDQMTSSPLNSLTGNLMSKTFLPVQISRKENFENWNEPPRFETIQQTLTRISTWAQTNGVRIVSGETCAMQMYPAINDPNGPQSTDLSPSLDKNFISIFRVYVDGQYPDPPLSMCPIAYRGWNSNPVKEGEPIPELESQQSCNLM